jgi:hypothetical protein
MINKQSKLRSQRTSVETQTSTGDSTVKLKPDGQQVQVGLKVKTKKPTPTLREFNSAGSKSLKQRSFMN